MWWDDALTWLNEHWYVYIIIGVLLLSFIVFIVFMIARTKSSSTKKKTSTFVSYQPLHESPGITPTQTPRQDPTLQPPAAVPGPYVPTRQQQQQQQQRLPVTYERFPPQQNQQYRSIPIRTHHQQLPPMPTSPPQAMQSAAPSPDYETLPIITHTEEPHYGKAPSLSSSTYDVLPEGSFKEQVEPVYGRLSDVTLNPQQYQQQHSDSLKRQMEQQYVNQ